MKNSTVVLDNGSHTIKLGFADDENSLVKLNTPGRFDQNFSNIDDKVFRLWEEGFSEKLAVDHCDRDGIIISRSLNQSEEESGKIIEQVFEKSGFRKAFLANAAVLSLIHSGRETGLVVDLGHRQIDIVPVYIGFPVPKGNTSLKLGGYDLTKALRNSFEAVEGLSMEEANEIKERICCILQNENDLTNSENSSYQLQNGKTVPLAKCKQDVIEGLFDPSLIGSEEVSSISSACYGSIVKTDVDLRVPLAANILLTGAASLLPHLAEKLQREVCERKNEMAGGVLRLVRPKVSVVADANLAAWYGGCKMARTVGFEESCLSRSEYEELGRHRAVKKYFF